jgi:release factor glutamine methyltransferase
LTEPVASALTVGAAVSEAAGRLEAAGVDTPRLDAELLLAEALGGGRAELILRAGEPVGSAVLERFKTGVDRRAAREPVAYILGRKWFRNIELSVDRRVLIPRPETELLVEVGLGLTGGARVLDVGTGSGAVALALKQERPDLDVVGSDASGDAVAVARHNAAALGLDVQFVRADLLEGLDRGVDAVLANLPYVAQGADLEPEIAGFEPAGALFAGPDGLEEIRRLVGTLDGIPLVALEVGFDQADAVSELVRNAGLRSVQRLRDLAGHERVVVGRR